MRGKHATHKQDTETSPQKASEERLTILMFRSRNAKDKEKTRNTASQAEFMNNVNANTAA